MLKNKEELAEHGGWTKCHCTIHLKMVNFTLHEFHINEKKENQKNRGELFFFFYLSPEFI